MFMEHRVTFVRRINNLVTKEFNTLSWGDNVDSVNPTDALEKVEH